MNKPVIEAGVRYLLPTEYVPVYYASEGGADAQMQIAAEFEQQFVDMYDARKLPVEASLDLEGFELHRHQTAIENFYKLKDHQPAYEEELRQLVLAVTGGSDLLVFDHTLRSDSVEIRAAHNIRETASMVHNDYTDASAQIRLRDLIPVDQVELRLQSRYAIINVWRSLKHPVLTTPMACVDAQTLVSGDLQAIERHSKERIGEIELACFNSAHRWYYYPAMMADEVLLIKTFDSATDGRARRSIHTAFSHPLAPADAPPRESIESRMLVFF
jgi:hypothetical protein